MELDKAARFVEDLLNFESDVGEEDEEDDKRAIVEEELEWISNKDSFPALESFILSEDPGTTLSKHNSPVSVLENSSTSSNSNSNSNSTNSNSNGSSKNNNKSLMSCCGDSFKVPGRARSKLCRRLRRDNQLFWSQQAAAANKIVKAEREVLTMRTTTTTTTAAATTTTTTTIGRKCQHCGAEKTPQWRAGPLGPKTLCNACGVRYKSGRLVPEYRPASSPTFSPKMHSNSHRKIVEMRRQKGMGAGMGMVVKSVDKG
ncbi:GATA transcription factor 1 [Quercus suber]|uniref:GATA transcription factor 1 n=1 Tax=Quercus suber TaxID=58331 RepID=UPI000CE1B5C0|nr:GATA transcription factor 1-like [Quercus suber]POF09216.1 gata transcription factor 1 [Quercus suber]